MKFVNTGIGYIGWKQSETDSLETIQDLLFFQKALGILSIYVI